MPGLSRHQNLEPRRTTRAHVPRRNGKGVHKTAGRDRTTNADPQLAVCARYDVLRALTHASGVEQITLWALPNKRYQVSFRIKNQAQEWYLATLRNKSTPRAFVNLGAAAHIAYGLAHTPIMIVNMSKVLQK